MCMRGLRGPYNGGKKECGKNRPFCFHHSIYTVFVLNTFLIINSRLHGESDYECYV